MKLPFLPPFETISSSFVLYLVIHLYLLSIFTAAAARRGDNRKGGKLKRIEQKAQELENLYRGERVRVRGETRFLEGYMDRCEA